MPTSRNLVVGLGVAVAAASLAVGGASAGLASPTGLTAPAHPRPAASAAPNPNAPHVGTVAGVQTGPAISINNPQSLHAFRELHAQMLGHTTPAGAQPQTIHEYVGSSFDSNTLGSQASQSVSTKIKPGAHIPALYTPTMYPSGGSCIEMTTAYFHKKQVVAAWDWCKAIKFVAQVTINKTFMKTYTQQQNYSVQIAQTDVPTNTWTSYLYNYTTATWQAFFTQDGASQSGFTVGWDMYEIYTDIKANAQSYACAALKGKRIEAQDIMVGVGGSWVLADPTNAGHAYDQPLANFDCKSLTYSMITPYNHWKAIG